MKIGFISDTHGYLDDTKKALGVLDGCDRILHLGDVLAPGPRNGIHPGYDAKELAEVFAKRDDIFMVKGNCDADVDEQVMNRKFLDNIEVFLEWGDLKIFALHGYRESLEERVQKAKKLGAYIVVVGHTHIKRFEEIDGIIYMCPGSPTLPKDGSKSVVIYEDGVFKFYNVDTSEVISSYKIGH